MRIFDRLSNGWKIGKMSLKTIQENPSLMLFPIISGFSLILVTLSYFSGGLFLIAGEIFITDAANTNLSNLDVMFDTLFYLLLFGFYMTNYFVIVFFNVGLVHCAKMILDGKETSIGEGLNFALSRIINILAWAILAATVGIILKLIQERAGGIGKIITGIIGVVWGIASYFVVPVIAYENVGPIQALKRSANIIKDKWGESIGANFSFTLFTALGILIIIPITFLLATLINLIVGIVIGIALFLVLLSSVSAANVVFLAAAYEHINNRPNKYFEGKILDDMFVKK